MKKYIITATSKTTGEMTICTNNDKIEYFLLRKNAKKALEYADHVNYVFDIVKVNE